jgi:hypothetical protein
MAAGEARRSGARACVCACVRACVDVDVDVRGHVLNEPPPFSATPPMSRGSWSAPKPQVYTLTLAARRDATTGATVAMPPVQSQPSDRSITAATGLRTRRSPRTRRASRSPALTEVPPCVLRSRACPRGGRKGKGSEC